MLAAIRSGFSLRCLLWTTLLSLLSSFPSTLLLLTAADSDSFNVNGVSVTAEVDGPPLLALQDITSAYLLVQPNTSIAINEELSISAAVSDIETGAVDFAVVSGGLDSEETASYPSLQMYPILCSALVPIYRLDALGSHAPALIISRPALALLYLGEITWWNDSRLQDTNSVTLPDQRVTMVLPADSGAASLVWTTALGKFWPGFSATVPPSVLPSWPLSAYWQWQQALGDNGQATAVIATDGTIGFAFQSMALQMDNNVFSLINQAGKTVLASADTVTFAAVELGTQVRSSTTAPMDLTDGTGSSVWPISVMSFLLLDTQFSPTTCHVRTAVVMFWQWFYSSSVAAGLMAGRQYAPVPSIVLTELDVLSSLATSVYCRGEVAVTAAQTSTRTIGAPAVSFLSGLFANLYQSVDASVLWTAQANSDQVTLQQLLDAEIDLAFVNLNNVDDTLSQGTLADPNFFVLPTYLIAPVVAFNPQLSVNLSVAGLLATGSVLTLSMQTLGLITYGCVSDWNDPRVLSENSWLADLLPPFDLQQVPMTEVIGCGITVEAAPQTFAMLGALEAYIAATGDLLLLSCVTNVTAAQSAAFAECTQSPTSKVLYVQDETAVAGMILGVAGSLGFVIADGSSSYGYAQLTDFTDGQWGNSSGGISGMSACVTSTSFNPNNLLVGSALNLSPGSIGAGCYAPTQQLVALLRSSYSSTATDASSCARGYDTLLFLQWFYTTQLIDVLVNNVDVVRISALSPDIQSAFIAALQSVTCDGETLLVTLPVQWTLASAIFAFVLSLGCIGLLGCAVLSGLVLHWRQHPIIRSASPLFLLLSIAGVALLFVSGFLLVAPVSTAVCSGFSWLLNVGLVVTFAPLFAKTWRIYRIFGRKKLSVVAISNRKLLLLCLCILGMEVLLMAVWQAVGNLQPIANDVTTSDVVSLSVSTGTTRFFVDEYLQCGIPSGSGRSMFSVIAVEKGLLFLFGALMAFSTRKVSSTFNESSGITLAIYNVCFTVGIIAPIILVISAVGDVLILLLAFALLWIAYFTAGILFVPKMLQIVYHTQANGEMNTSMQQPSQSSSGYVFMSLAALSTLPVLQSYQLALQKHLAQVDAKVGLMKGTTGGGKAISSGKPKQPQPQFAATLSKLPAPSKSLLSSHSRYGSEIRGDPELLRAATLAAVTAGGLDDVGVSTGGGRRTDASVAPAPSARSAIDNGREDSGNSGGEQDDDVPGSRVVKGISQLPSSAGPNRTLSSSALQ